MLACMIDAIEKQDIATVDILGAFMQTDMDEMVHMRLEGTMAGLLATLGPKMYCKYIQVENEKGALC